MSSKDRYILVLKKNYRKKDVSNIGPDKIRYDTKLKEFVYGADSYYETKTGRINLSNKVTRKDTKNMYGFGGTSDETYYRDEDGKLYRTNDALDVYSEMIFDAAKPDEIREDLIED